MRLEGRTALVSGAGRNSGKAIALAFAREGADVILVARTAAEVERVASECEVAGVRALALTGDVGKPEDVDRIVHTGLQHFGKVDVLASVAAIRPHRPLGEYTREEWHHVFAINLHATFYLAQALTPGMKERKCGSIIALGGMASMTALRPHTAAVVASKHGLYGLIKALAMELGPYGVRANLITVGSIATERRNLEWYPPGENPHASSHEHDNTPLRRAGTTQEIANLALFLASDESSYITGDRISCTGGRYM